MWNEIIDAFARLLKLYFCRINISSVLSLSPSRARARDSCIHRHPPWKFCANVDATCDRLRIIRRCEIRVLSYFANRSVNETTLCPLSELLP